MAGLLVVLFPVLWVILLPIELGFSRGGSWTGPFVQALISGAISGAIVGAVSFWLSAHDEVWLTAYGITSAHIFRTTDIGWGNIVAVDERRVLGSRQVQVIARRRSITLRALSSGPGTLFADADFDAKVATIRAWQQACTPAAARRRSRASCGWSGR
jgi:hypothetical protein